MIKNTRDVLDYLLLINRDITYESNLKKMLLRAIKQAAQRFDFTFIEIYLLESHHLSRVASYPNAVGPARIPLTSENSLTVAAVKARQTQLLQTVKPGAPLLPSAVRKYAISSAIAVPLWEFDNIIGALILARSDPHRRIGPNESGLVEVLAMHLSNAIKLTQRLEITRRQQQDLQATYDSAIHTLVSAIEFRDFETRVHSERAAAVSFRLAKEMGFPLPECHDIRYGALLHDIGKIGIADDILLKRGDLTPDEWKTMKQHPEKGWQLARQMLGLRPRSLNIIRHHHEHFDGTGYPDGLSGVLIPLEARLFAVVDAYDALRNDRPYRRGTGHEAALAEIRCAAGSQFCPECVACFSSMHREVEALYR